MGYCFSRCQYPTYTETHAFLKKLILEVAAYDFHAEKPASLLNLLSLYESELKQEIRTLREWSFRFPIQESHFMLVHQTQCVFLLYQMMMRELSPSDRTHFHLLKAFLLDLLLELQACVEKPNRQEIQSRAESLVHAYAFCVTMYLQPSTEA